MRLRFVTLVAPLIAGGFAASAYATDAAWNPPAAGTQLVFNSQEGEQILKVTGSSASGILYLDAPRRQAVHGRR